METQIFIIGRPNLLNQLLKDFLEIHLNGKCHICANIPDFNGKKDENFFFPLILINFQSNAFDLLFKKWEKGNHNGDFLFAFVNFSGDFKLNRDLLDTGLRGIFFKNDSPKIILKGINAILDGDLWFSRDIMKYFLLNKEFNQNVISEKPLLSFREKEILALVSTGMSNMDISEKLLISIHTVKTHLYNIFKKIDVPNRLQASLWAAKNLHITPVEPRKDVTINQKPKSYPIDKIPFTLISDSINRASNITRIDEFLKINFLS